MFRNLNRIILDHKNSLNKHNLPYLIYGTAYNQLVFFNSETPYHAQNLNFNINDKSQNEIAKQIINYVNDIDKNPNVIVDRILIQEQEDFRMIRFIMMRKITKTLLTLLILKNLKRLQGN